MLIKSSSPAALARLRAVRTASGFTSMPRIRAAGNTRFRLSSSSPDEHPNERMRGAGIFSAPATTVNSSGYRLTEVVACGWNRLSGLRS